MTHDHRARLARAQQAVEMGGLSAVVVTPSADLVYLVGDDVMQLERLTALVIPAKGDPVLVVPELERPRAATSPAGSMVEMVAWRDDEGPYQTLTKLLDGATRLGAADRMLASHLLSLQTAMPGVSFVPASSVLSPLRVRKDSEEIELLTHAGRGADQAFARILEEKLEGRSEREVALDLGELLLENGHDSVAFGIVGSGPNGASPHHHPGDRVIGQGDLVVLDFGGRVGGYCSDVTRTVSVGEPSPEAVEVHEIVRRAQQAAFDAVRPGIPAENVDRAARQVIEEAGYGEDFIHRTGHGIGLEEHEDPYIVAGNREPLEPGMCFSIEPGIYLEGRFGVRIEDIVTVTQDGPVRLNEASRDLLVVG